MHQCIIASNLVCIRSGRQPIRTLAHCGEIPHHYVVVPNDAAKGVGDVALKID